MVITPVAAMVKRLDSTPFIDGRFIDPATLGRKTGTKVGQDNFCDLQFVLGRFNVFVSVLGLKEADMSKRLVILLVLSITLALVMFLLAIESYSSAPWQSWQNQYFQVQIESLKNELSVVQDSEQIRKLEQELKVWQEKKPEIEEIRLSNGRVERCTTCHLGIEEISRSHSKDSIGCTACHGGNPLSIDEKTAHEGMYGEGHPGQLKVARLSCGGNSFVGQCHSGNKQEADNPVDLLTTSLMASKSGELSMTRYAHGLDIPPKILLKPGETASELPAPFNNLKGEPKLQENCLVSCHLNRGKLPGQEQAVANGCETCHVPKNWQQTYEGTDVTIPRDKVGLGISHRLTAQIPYTQCNQCHNQGEYTLDTMEFIPRHDLDRVKASPPSDQESLETRWKNVYSPGLVFTKCEVNLDCADCHTREEVMGDGEMYVSEWKALKIQCRDCHGSIESKPIEWKITQKSDSAWRQEQINPIFPELKMGDVILKTAKGEELPYVRKENDKWYSYRKTNAEKFEIPQVIGSDCLQDPNKQTADDCHQCHDVSKDPPSTGGIKRNP
jgi:hypothetical protein